MGFNFKSFLLSLAQVAPFAMQAAGVPEPLIPVATHAIALAEIAGSVKGLDGPGKKAYAMDAVNTGIQLTNAIKPVIPDTALDAVSTGIDATLKAIKVAQSIPAVKPSGPVA